VILKGNLAPEGCVMKIAAANRVRASRPGARLRLRRRLLSQSCAGRQIKPGDVLVIRYEGPKGGPGMREMLQVTAAISRTPS
jgi:dihydroxy-acid dehydratase